MLVMLMLMATHLLLLALVPVALAVTLVQILSTLLLLRRMIRRHR